MRFWPQRSNQSGDTIVEVLIVIAVISSVLAGAFLVTQKSSTAVRSSQEHSEILQLLQGQVELLRAAALEQTDTTTGVFAASPAYFCMDAGLGSPTYGNVVPQPSLSTNLSSYSNYNSQCAKLQSRYYIAIHYDGSGDKTFTFYGRWDTPGGTQGTEELRYRISPELVSAVGRPSPPLVPLAPGGIADLIPAGCLRDPDGTCSAGLSPPSYHWLLSAVNNSNNPGLTVINCRWEWKDETGAIVGVQNDKCNYTDKQSFLYPDPGWTDYPARCKSLSYSVVLYLTLSNGTRPNKTFSLDAPACY